MRKHKQQWWVMDNHNKLHVQAYDMRDVVQQHPHALLRLESNSICSGLCDGDWNVSSRSGYVDLYRAWNYDARLQIARIHNDGSVGWAGW